MVKAVPTEDTQVRVLREFTEVLHLKEAINETVALVEGSFLARVQTKYCVDMEIQFEVSKSVRRPLLGTEACFDLNLLRRVNQPVKVSLVTTDVVVQESKDEFIAKHRDVFEGLGQFKQTIHLDVDKDVAPGMCPPRRYSFAIADRLKAKLDSLVSQIIIGKVTGEMPKFRKTKWRPEALPPSKNVE
ncbi:hypothetical protein FOCC_FOCC015736 [Frankliniella occidentalis]|nr:hypothetical protein FOCC_FOCC015736 [Frankliniella occidentalis]